MQEGENKFKCVRDCPHNLAFVDGDNTCVSECASGIYTHVNVPFDNSGNTSATEYYKCVDSCPGNYTLGRKVDKQYYTCVNGCGKDQLLVVSGNS